jgi:hypothetical protein
MKRKGAGSGDRPVAARCPTIRPCNQAATGRQTEAKGVDIALVLHGADAATDYWAGVVRRGIRDLTAALSYYEAASPAPLVPAYVAAQAETLLAVDARQMDCS